MSAAVAPIHHAGGSEPLRLVAARGDEALALLDDRWDDLVARQSLPNPLLSAAWLRALARWGTGIPLVLLAEAGDALAAGVALELRRSGRLGTTVAAWLGPFEQLFSPDALADPAWPDAPAAVFAAAFEHAGALRLERTPAHGVAATALARAAPWRKCRETGVRWVAPCPPPRLERMQRRLAAERERADQRGATVEVRVAAGPDEIRAGLVRLFRVHRDRWRGRPGLEPRLAATGALRRWNDDTVTELARLGRARLAEVRENGRVVAADLGFLIGRGAIGHTTAMRDAVHLRQPGVFATSALIEALTDAGATAIDLGIGMGGPGTAKDRFAPVGEPVQVVIAAHSAARQRRLDLAARLREAVAQRR